VRELQDDAHLKSMGITLPAGEPFWAALRGTSTEKVKINPKWRQRRREVPAAGRIAATNRGENTLEGQERLAHEDAFRRATFQNPRPFPNRRFRRDV
jgi:hypothetical protein